MSKVYVHECENYDYLKIKNIVDSIFIDIGGIDKIIKKGTRVLIKPNLLSKRSPDMAITTSPILIQAVANAVIEAGGIATIADSRSYYGFYILGG